MPETQGMETLMDTSDKLLEDLEYVLSIRLNMNPERLLTHMTIARAVVHRIKKENGRLSIDEIIAAVMRDFERDFRAVVVHKFLRLLSDGGHVSRNKEKRFVWGQSEKRR